MNKGQIESDFNSQLLKLRSKSEQDAGILKHLGRGLMHKDEEMAHSLKAKAHNQKGRRDNRSS